LANVPDFKPLTLEDRSIFNEFLAQTPPETSELTFTNLFIWRHCYDPLWTVCEDCIVTLFLDKGDARHAFQPIGSGDVHAALDFVTEYMMDRFGTAVISRVGPTFAGTFGNPEKLEIIEDRNNSDYVYLGEELINLPGNRFHKKKNLLNQFLKKHEFQYQEVGPELVVKILELQENWCEIKRCEEDAALLDEDRAVYEALKRMDMLQFRGGAIVIDGKVAAFSLGEMLNPDTAVIHIEKGDPSITGIYAAMNKLFCENAWSHAKFINREQDLGIEGLRKAKLSYNPHHIVTKYTLQPR